MFRLWERLGEGIQSQAGESGAGALRAAEPLRAAIKAGALPQTWQQTWKVKALPAT